MKERALSYLRKALNDSRAKFRDGQWECIEAIVRGERRLVVQRTGWGKSIVYFLGTRMLRDRGSGPTLVISPLLSLMRNQLVAAERIGVQAATINSTNTDEWERVEADLLAGQIDVLLISPERLSNEEFRERVLHNIAGRVGLFVVDEAHCISDWGHDFRPDYRRIIRILQTLPKNIPILATTATANNRVVQDVSQQLTGLRVTRGPLIRESLSLQNIGLPSPPARLAWLAQHLEDLPGSGIIYVLTVRDAEQVAAWLKHNGFNVEAYHAKVDDTDKASDTDTQGNRRKDLERRLLENELKALVATVALGMGFDKPDLGFVIHFQRPGSVVHYYQQVGRAGRAVDHAHGILLSGEEDKNITDYFIRTAFPPIAHVEQVLSVLNAAEDGLSVPMLQRAVNLSKGAIEKVLKLLSVEEPSPVVKIGSKWNATPVNYVRDEAKVDAICALRQREQQEMLEYMDSSECLMLYLGRALDDPASHTCGKCANCVGRPLVSEVVNGNLANEAAAFLRRQHYPLKPRRRWPVKDMFEHLTFKGISIDKELVAEEGRALSLWGDAGWGDLVRHGKYGDGRFDDALLAACEELLETWKPEPAPTWVACIPSLTHPDLVPDFSERLASRLKLPFSACLTKVKQNQPQKHMQNSYQQAKNLDGVFYVEAAGVFEEPVLLVDDVVDSRWTFTVVAAMLREAGCSAVFPLVLALNSPRMD